MSWIPQYPLNIVPGGDGKQSGFTKIKNEFTYLYGVISGLFATNGHAHTGNGNDGAVIPASNITNTPAGNLASTDQQAINAELDSRGYGDNLFINPLFQIWQRGFSFVISPGSSAYTSDRKLIVNNTNQSVTITRYQYSNKQFALRMAATTTSPTTGTVDIIERSVKDDLARKTGVGCLEGQYAVVQFEVDGVDPTFFFRQFFGAGGSPSASVDTSVALTKTSLGGTANKYTGSVLIPGISGKTIGTTVNTDYLQSTLSIPLRGSAVSIMASQCQYGKVNSLIRQRSNELQLCQEYYEKSYDLSTIPGTATTIGYVFNTGPSGGVVSAVLRFKAEKRAVPSVNVWDATGNPNVVTTYTAGGTPTTRNPSIAGVCTSGCTVAAATSDTAIAFQYTVDAEIY
jgi:hypothetical protein